MPALSFKDLCIKACIKQAACINDIGDSATYHLMRPVLLKIENPKQLRELEKNSPQIVGDDEELWINLIKRDVPDGESEIVRPKNPANWYKVYRKIIGRNTTKINQDIEALKATLKGHKDEKAKHESRLVDPRTLPKLPRMYGMRAEKRKNVFGNTPNTSVLSFASGSKTKTLTGKDVLVKARREARELSLFSARKAVLATPTHKLQEKATKIHAVPQTYINDHKRAAAAPKDLSKLAAQPAKTPNVAPAQLAGQKRSIAYLEDSDDDDDEDDDDEDLFGSGPEDGERRLVAVRRPTAKPAAAPKSTAPAPKSLLSHFSPPLLKAPVAKPVASRNPLPSLVSPPPDVASPKRSIESTKKLPATQPKSSQAKDKLVSGPARSKPLSPPSEPARDSSPPSSSDTAGPSRKISPPRKLMVPRPQGRPRTPVNIFMPVKRRKVAR